MPLVGDVIVRARNAAADPCQTVGQPIAPVVGSSGLAGIFTGTVYFIITYLTQWGETVGSSEASGVISANHAANLSGLSVPYAALALRAYFATSTGQEFQYIQVAVTSATTSVNVGLGTDVVVSGVPPYKPSAYLPDTDGDLVSAYEVYRWLNAGLVQLGRLAGGILDQTGVAMPAGNAEVVIPGWWLEIKYTWHNGWLVIPEKQSYTWLQSPVQGIPGISTLWRNGAQQVFGTWPQPNQAPAQTTLSAQMAATDTVANVVSSSGFTAPGMCIIDNETMSYSQASGTQLTGVVRGYSGTIPAVHLNGATVNQGIFRLMGYRMPVAVAVGQSANILDVPLGWDTVLDDFLSAKFKETEQNIDEAQKMMAQFETRARELRDKSIPLDSKQIGGLYPLGGAAQTLAEIQDTVIVN